MTEIEKIAYAKSFIDKLAIGIDPTDGTLIPDGEVALNPRLSKCFLYVADILSKIIENPSALAEMYKTNEWIVTPDVLARIECSALRVGISTFAKRVNDALRSTRKFTATEINNWLLHEGYLTRIATSDNKMTKRPTQKGVNLGITTDEVIKDNGRAKYYVRCNVNAQRFIRDHLSEIIEFSKTSVAYSDTSVRHKSSEPFEITQAELAKFEFSETPLMISQITERINALKTNTSAAKLKATDITEWLLSVGILKVVALDAKNYKLPSDIGSEMGISVERRSSSNGEYSIALYNIEAQKFIIDNLHAIVRII